MGYILYVPGHSENMYARLSSGVEAYILNKSLYILRGFVCMTSECPDETARMRRLATVFAGRICGKYQYIMDGHLIIKVN